MSTLKTGALRGTSGTADTMTLHESDGSVEIPKLKVGSDAAGDILYHNGTNYVRLAKGTDGQVLKLASGVPTWADPPSEWTTASVLSLNGNNSVATGNIFPNTVKHIQVQVVYARTANINGANDQLEMRAGYGSSPTYLTNGYEAQTLDVEGSGNSVVTATFSSGFHLDAAQPQIGYDMHFMIDIFPISCDGDANRSVLMRGKGHVGTTRWSESMGNILLPDNEYLTGLKFIITSAANNWDNTRGKVHIQYR